MTEAKLDGRRADVRGTARERLLDAAARVFAERGYLGATVDDIAAAAGVTKGAVYWNFASKDEVFFALVEERVDRRARELMGVTEDAPRTTETAPLVSRGITSFADEQRLLVLVLQEYWSMAARDDELREAYVERQRVLREHLAKALAARHRKTGVPLSIPAKRLATGIMALAIGLAQERIVDQQGVPEDLLGEMLSLLYDGLAHRAEQR